MIFLRSFLRAVNWRRYSIRFGYSGDDNDEPKKYIRERETANFFGCWMCFADFDRWFELHQFSMIIKWTSHNEPTNIFLAWAQQATSAMVRRTDGTFNKKKWNWKNIHRNAEGNRRKSTVLWAWFFFFIESNRKTTNQIRKCANVIEKAVAAKNVSCRNCDRNPDGEKTGDEWNQPRTKFPRNLVFVGPTFPQLAKRVEIRYAMCRIVEAALFIFFCQKIH